MAAFIMWSSKFVKNHEFKICEPLELKSFQHNIFSREVRKSGLKTYILIFGFSYEM